MDLIVSNHDWIKYLFLWCFQFTIHRSLLLVHDWPVCHHALPLFHARSTNRSIARTGTSPAQLQTPHTSSWTTARCQLSHLWTVLHTGTVPQDVTCCLVGQVQVPTEKGGLSEDDHCGQSTGIQWQASWTDTVLAQSRCLKKTRGWCDDSWTGCCSRSPDLCLCASKIWTPNDVIVNLSKTSRVNTSQKARFIHASVLCLTEFAASSINRSSWFLPATRETICCRIHPHKQQHPTTKKPTTINRTFSSRRREEQERFRK